MSFLKNIFGSSNEEVSTPKMDWILLKDIGQLNEIVVASESKPVLIFKHSTRCSISRMALKQFENEFNFSELITPYYLDLLNYRDISNQIATKFNVMHQSPQIVLIKNGVCIYSETHENIDAKLLASKI
ncbi:bacillithiol system redox-active protein YtxJ [Flavobacterium sp.]|uniref:bacillithiol system redox-active protein YtxJ n=1 Tax=Flavobacterium sp. TaxID=239 RepID=UPI00286E3B27|nr:bacillithiol system redox-active protein YtxJ [Flavobacterium sp.]